MTTSEPLTDLKVELLEHDGNSFLIMGKVVKTLKGHGYDHLARRFNVDCSEAQNYDEFLNVVRKYVEVI